MFIVVLARKLPSVVVPNVLTHQTGALAIHKCRSPTGRWPANLLLSHLMGCDDTCVPACPVTDLDRQSGVTRSCRSTVEHDAYDSVKATHILSGVSHPDNQYDDVGGASRFFWTSRRRCANGSAPDGRCRPGRLGTPR